MTPDEPAAYPRLLGDVGGTSVRFGWLESAGAAIGRVAAYPDADHDGLESVVRAYLREQALSGPAACALGVASPVLGDAVALTNRAWTFSISALQRRLGLERLVVINDFAALALSLPRLGAHELRPVGGGMAVPGAPRALLGAGTGLGVSGLLTTPRGSLPIMGEGGHVSVCASNDAEDRIVIALRRRYGHVSAERVLSGAGLVALYDCLCAEAGRPAEPLTPADVTARALQGGDAACREAIQYFFAFLGSVAGNLALTLGALGGVYIGGGIVPRLGSWIDRSPFRERFESKGRYRAYLAAIPVWVIADPASAALRGANIALDA